MFITKDTKWQRLCCCHDKSFANGPVLIETEIPSFCLNQGPSTPANLMMRVKTIWEPRRLKMRIFGFWQKETGAGCHLVSFVMYISGTKFEEHCFNISFTSVWNIFMFSCCWSQDLCMIRSIKPVVLKQALCLWNCMSFKQFGPPVVRPHVGDTCRINDNWS